MYLVVLFHYGKTSYLSSDSIIRLLAARAYKNLHDVEKVFFVGGSYLKPSGAVRMLEFWRNKITQNDGFLLDGDDSSTTISNLTKIKSLCRDNDYKSVKIITSKYHCSRVNFYMPEAEVLPAEDLLLLNGSDQEVQLVEKRLAESNYVLYEFMDKILFKLSWLDKIFQKFRKNKMKI